MKNRTLLRTGIIGSAVTALCCFTPVLVVLFGAIGLSAIVGYLDYVLLPAFAVFVGIMIYAFVRRHGEGAAEETGTVPRPTPRTTAATLVRRMSRRAEQT